MLDRDQSLGHACRGREGGRGGGRSKRLAGCHSDTRLRSSAVGQPPGGLLSCLQPQLLGADRSPPAPPPAPPPPGPPAATATCPPGGWRPALAQRHSEEPRVCRGQIHSPHLLPPPLPPPLPPVCCHLEVRRGIFSVACLPSTKTQMKAVRGVHVSHFCRDDNVLPNTVSTRGSCSSSSV